MYYIGTGKLYFGQNTQGMFVTEKLQEARMFKDKKVATNALTGLPRSFYQRSAAWSVRQDIGQVVEASVTMPPENKQGVVVDAPTEPVESDKIAEGVDTSIDFLKLIETLSELQKHRDDYLNDLHTQLSEVDLELCDLEHYIEFSKCNVAEAYKCYKMVRDTLQKRREIKNQIKAAAGIINHCDLYKTRGEYIGIANQKYTPRRLTGLFKTKE